VKLVDRLVHIDADVAEVYALLTDAERFVNWMAPTATLDPTPGGVITWTHRNGDVVFGNYVEVVPNQRVVFTFGWERADVEVPPGSTTVEINLRATAEGTELHLVHRGLPGPMADAHAAGWDNNLRRLAVVAAGRDPGPTSSPPSVSPRRSRWRSRADTSTQRWPLRRAEPDPSDDRHSTVVAATKPAEAAFRGTAVGRARDRRCRHAEAEALTRSDTRTAARPGKGEAAGSIPASPTLPTRARAPLTRNFARRPVT
jgi:uncharacterized protein YndB with AHSA1/START domain